jgi:hypothetical protein
VNHHGLRPASLSCHCFADPQITAVLQLPRDPLSLPPLSPSTQAAPAHASTGDPNPCLRPAALPSRIRLHTRHVPSPLMKHSIKLCFA